MKSVHALCAPSWYRREWVCRIQGWLSQLLCVGLCSPLIMCFSVIVAVKVGQTDLWDERFLLSLFRRECYIKKNCHCGAELHSSSLCQHRSSCFYFQVLVVCHCFCSFLTQTLTETSRYLASRGAMRINKWPKFFIFKPIPFFPSLKWLVHCLAAAISSQWRCEVEVTKQ